MLARGRRALRRGDRAGGWEAHGFGAEEVGQEEESGTLGGPGTATAAPAAQMARSDGPVTSGRAAEAAEAAEPRRARRIPRMTRRKRSSKGEQQLQRQLQRQLSEHGTMEVGDDEDATDEEDELDVRRSASARMRKPWASGKSLRGAFRSGRSARTDVQSDWTIASDFVQFDDNEDKTGNMVQHTAPVQTQQAAKTQPQPVQQRPVQQPSWQTQQMPQQQQYNQNPHMQHMQRMEQQKTQQPMAQQPWGVEPSQPSHFAPQPQTHTHAQMQTQMQTQWGAESQWQRGTLDSPQMERPESMSPGYAGWQPSQPESFGGHQFESVIGRAEGGKTATRGRFKRSPGKKMTVDDGFLEPLGTTHHAFNIPN